MPTEMLAQNMSNRVPDEFRSRVKTVKKSSGKKGLNKVLDTPFVKNGLLAIYDRIFRWYYD
jgi:hypothetical protein